MRDKLFDDIASVLGSAAGMVSDLGSQVRSDVRDRLKGVADKIELVSREEFDALEARIAALEAQLTAKSPAPVKKTDAKKTEAKKAAPKKAAAKKAPVKKAAKK